jgi:hypothetical protein
MNQWPLGVARLLLGVAILGMTAASARASTITISTIQHGWWDSTGRHTATNLNYATGDDATGLDHRSFFVFDLSGVTGTISTATLRFNPPSGYNSPDPTETLSFFDVTTSSATLLATGVGQVVIYNDLGTGVSYGLRSVSPADNNTIVTQLLNAAATAAIQAALGGSFAVGGALTTLNQPARAEVMFSFSNLQATELVLEVTEVPEPTSVLLVATGVVAVARRRRRSRVK